MTAAQRFESLLSPVLGAAYGTALNFTRNQPDAENLVQEAALRAFRAFKSFQEGTNFKAWFLKIVTNLFFEQYRRDRRRPPSASLEEAPDLFFYGQVQGAGLMGPAEDPAETVLNRLDVEKVRDALEQLPEEYRSVCMLYFLHEQSYQEIAEVVGCPIGTIRSRLHRGRKLLQKALWDVAQQSGIVPA